MEFRPGIIEDVAAQIPDRALEAVERVPRWGVLRGVSKWAVGMLAMILVIDGVGSLLVRREAVRKRLTARLEAAFGRPVEVQSYAFTLWAGPTLEAKGVTVGEDPRFGHEYFLRSDSLAIRLRWLSLLRGRFELGALSLTEPTLNVVDDAAGDWNLAEWLGHPAAPAANIVGPVRVPFVPRLQRIEVSDGRINFKDGEEKLPFAFVSVNGTVYSDGPQRWRLDLEAAPWRAAALLQEPGTIHVAGSVGGTSSALRPASVEMSWTAASASDFLRLLTGDDSGVRGTVAIGANVQTAAEGWTIQMQALLAQLHRWDLVVRPDAPAVDLTAKMHLDVAASRLDIADLLVQAPHSNARGAGRILWDGASLQRPPAAQTAFQIDSASIDFSDALAWLRAFRQNIPASLSVRGFAEGQAMVSGWPVRVTELHAHTRGAELSGARLVGPLRLGQASVDYDGSTLRMPPATITLDGAKSAAASSLRVEYGAVGKRSSPKTADAGLHVSGSATNAADAIAAVNAFGWDIARGWQLAGPLDCDFRWLPGQWPWSSAPTGTVSVGGTGDAAASLRAPFLNLPVSGIEFQMDLKPRTRHVTLAGADAFGAHWTGSFDRDDSGSGWQFALSADQLTAADLDRWLNPLWRKSFVDRMLPFLNATPATAVPENLRGKGRLSIDQFSAAPFMLRNLSGDLAVNGRDVRLDSAAADFGGGKLTGALHAKLPAIPNYAGNASFSGVDIGGILGERDTATGPFGGTASGQVQFSMVGTTRGNFADSLDCKGALNVRNATWRGVSLFDSLEAARFIPGESAFGEAASQLACTNGAIALKDIVLTNGRAAARGEGSVDFSRRLDLTLRVGGVATGGSPIPATAIAPGGVHVGGTPAAPEFTRILAARRAR